MKTYLFNTYATMKEYNNEKYWIDGGIIPKLFITAENLKEAFEKYQDITTNQYYITITKTGIKTRKPMYIDTTTGPKQTGYCITAATDIQKDNYEWTKQYIDLWVEIIETKHPDFIKEKIA